MQVKLTVSRAGQRDGRPYTEDAGDVISVSDEEGKRLIARGQAVPVAAAPKRRKAVKDKEPQVEERAD